MKKSRMAMVAGASATMITIGWRIGTQPLPSLVIADDAAGEAIASGPAASPTPAASSTTAAPATAAPATAPEQPPPPAGPSGTFIGSAVKTEFGTMQVQIIVSEGRIVDVQPLVLGLSDSKSIQINNQAVPILEQRVLAAQSAKVSYVSGASYTSQGYLASVASAISKAGI